MAQHIVNFLDTHLDVPQRLRDAIVHMHAGKRPLWRALSATRGVNQIIEIALHGIPDGDKRKIAVVRWFWTDRHIGLTWRNFATMHEAQAYQEQTFRIDGTQEDVRA